MDTRCSLDDQQGAMDDRNRCQKIESKDTLLSLLLDDDDDDDGDDGIL